MSDGSFAGRVAVITGGAQGIGAACSRKLVALGVSVVIGDRKLEIAEALATELGERAAAFALDVTDEQSCVDMVTFATSRFGRLDIAVNNAGLANVDRSRAGFLSFSSWRTLMSVNLDGVFLSMKAEIPAMIASGGGSIVNIASVMGTVAVECGSAYVASKHGVVGLTRAAALDHAADGIRVNAIGPGYVKTPMLEGRTPEQLAEVDSRHPLGRIAEPEEVAAVMAFLASPDSSFVTGAYYMADGGYTIR